MIIDAHAHLVAPSIFYAYRSALLASGGYYKGTPAVSDEALAEAAERNVKVMDSAPTSSSLLRRPHRRPRCDRPVTAGRPPDDPRRRRAVPAR